MHNVIYVPDKPENEGMAKERVNLITEFANNGWILSGHLLLTDPFGQKVSVAVLTKPIA